MPMFRTIKKTLFDMLFVMTDGAARPSKSAFQKVVILYTIDLLQVIRVMLSPVYGWSASTYNIAKHIDIVYNLVALASIFVPRYTFFIIAFLLVSFAIGDGIYCARLFYNNEINTIGPIKILRFMVTALVTTLFSSMLKWLLIPLECHYVVGKVKYQSLSSYIHDDPGRCSPWDVPELIISIPTVIAACLYMGFAATFSYFSLEPNCLSCHPNARFTGQVEVLFLLTKIATTCLTYGAKAISPLATGCVIFLMCSTLLYRHLSVLPFHSHSTNLFRGGVYGVVCWLGICNVFVAVIKEMKVEDEFWRTTFEWILLACIPISFPMGLALVQKKRNKLLLSIDRLRGEWEAQASAEKGLSLELQGPGTQSQQRRRMSLELLEALPTTSVLRTQARKRSPYEDFFDPSWERKRAFSSGSQALTVARLLLYQREESDLPFLSYVVSRALEEFPNSETLKLFRLSLLRFVFRNTAEAAIEEKKLRNSNTKLSSDNAYVLYAVERKASQECASNNMGKGGHFNAINLMEFESGMGQAREYHQEAIEQMKLFWQNASKDLKDKTQDIWQGCVEVSVNRLIDFDKALHKAKHEYSALLEKYPQSVQLLLSYASFCDVVLNDYTQGEERRRQAMMLDGVDEETLEPNGMDRMEAQANMSCADQSEADTFRNSQAKNFLAWSTSIFGAETSALRAFTFQLRLGLALLGIASITGFCCTQFWLFGVVAGEDTNLVNGNGMLRTMVVSTAFLVRSQMLAANRNDSVAFADLAEEFNVLSADFKLLFRESYLESNRHGLRDFYLEDRYEVAVPYATGWNVERMDLWELGNEWAVRIERASMGTMEEFADPDFGPKEVDDSKAGVKFINENVLRVMLPAFEHLLGEYDGGAKDLWHLTQTLMIAVVSVEGAMQLVIAMMLLHALVTNIQKIQHLYLGTVLALSVNGSTSKSLFRFYRQALQELKESAGEQGSHSEHEDDLQSCEESFEDDQNEAEHNQPISPPSTRRRWQSSFDDGREPVLLDDSCLLDQPPHPIDRSASPMDGRAAFVRPGSPGSRISRLTTGNLNKFAREACTSSFHSMSSFIGTLGDPPQSCDRRAGSREPHQEISMAPSASGLGNDTTVLRREPQAFPASMGTPPRHLGEDQSAGVFNHSDASSEDSSIKRKVEDILNMDGGNRGVNDEHCNAKLAADGRPDRTGDPLQIPRPYKAPRRSSLKPAVTTPGFQPLRNDVALLGDFGSPKGSPQRLASTIKMPPLANPPSISGSTDSGPAFPGRASVTFKSQLDRMLQANSPGKGDITRQGGSGGAVIKREDEDAQKKDPPVRVIFVDDVEVLPSNQVTMEQKKAIRNVVRRHTPMVMRRMVYVAALSIVMTLCVLNATFPARRVDEVVNLSPTINQAGRRRSLARVCAFLARELILDDGFSRLSKRDIASGLSFYLKELKRVDDAVRLGGDLDINQGADNLYDEHNRIMYSLGCPWREADEAADEEVDHTAMCATPVRPGVAEQGLHHLFIAFTQAVENILHREWPDKESILSAKKFFSNPRVQVELDSFDNVDLPSDFDKQMTRDSELAFVLEMYDGDLYQGFDLVTQKLNQEFVEITSQAASSNRTLFICYMLMLYGVVYWLLFSKAAYVANLEAKRARNFVGRIPVFCLSKIECDSIVHLFSKNFYK